MTRVLTSGERAEFCAAAEATLLREAGQVSIVTYLGGVDEADARNRWCDALDDVLVRLPDGMFLGPDLTSGALFLAFDGGLRLRVDLWELRSRATRDDAWCLRVSPRLASAIVDAAASLRWGEHWRKAMGAVDGDKRPPVNALRERFLAGWAAGVQSELVAEGRPLGWVIPGAPADAPWPWFGGESRARAAATAMGLGVDRLRELYVQVERGEDR